MMIRPRLSIGDRSAERGPMTTSGDLAEVRLRMSIQRSRRLARVCWEWMRTTRWPKVCSKILTSWLVRAISGTRRMADLPMAKVSAVSLR